MPGTHDSDQRANRQIPPKNSDFLTKIIDFFCGHDYCCGVPQNPFAIGVILSTGYYQWIA